MNIPFKFSIRLLAAVLIAKFVLGFLGADTLPGLLWGSLGLVLLTYLFDLLDWYSEGALRRALKPSALSWLAARLLVRMNVVEPPKESSAEPKTKEGEG
ncbi:MAG: hypothetical protein C4567_02795 [Deltaproteobacteria bacterium]|nr:MAG: hypothetical protein C4567_02795 [Deltaproteobacteria bacterium]